MLFNSGIFILGFLPLAVLLTALLGRFYGRRAALGGLAFASLMFYTWWDPPYVLIFLGSVFFNFYVGRAVSRARMPARKAFFIAGLAANLMLLGFFKYAFFAASVTNSWFGLDLRWPALVLPLGISFYTFQKLAYLVDCYKGKVGELRLLDYLLFVSFFPQLIAGPIVHYRDIIPQFEQPDACQFRARDLAAGLSLFALGLGKKILLADPLAPVAQSVFHGAAQGQAFGLADAWVGVLAYTFQLYYDFSGYSDMAIGLGAMFGIRLPVNFRSPYQATSIIDFWRRWHITLSAFLRDYVYIPLGGNRKGMIRRFANLFLTMVIGGIWHGAGWTFLVWGALHGGYLLVNHGWIAVRARLGPPSGAAFSRVGGLLGWALTFVCVVFGWTMFRAETLESALGLWKSMIGLHGAGTLSAATGVSPATLSLLGVAAGIAFLGRNLAEWIETWKPSPVFAYALGVLFAICLLRLGRPSEFLYFQF